MLTDAPMAMMMQPVIWNALGYQFEAAPMLAALSACLVVRIWVCLSAPPIGVRARGLNLSVTAIAMLFTAGWIVLQRPSPFFALLSGSGFGALGSGIIAISLSWVRRLEPLDQLPTAPSELPNPTLHGEAVRRRARRAAGVSRRSNDHVQS